MARFTPPPLPTSPPPRRGAVAARKGAVSAGTVVAARGGHSLAGWASSRASVRGATRRTVGGGAIGEAGYSNATPAWLRAIAIAVTDSHTFVAGSYLSTEMSELELLSSPPTAYSLPSSTATA